MFNTKQKNTVTIVPVKPDSMEVVIPCPNNPDYSTFCVESIFYETKGNFTNQHKRYAYIKGETKFLESLKLKLGQTFPGKIIKEERYTPFYEGQLPKMNPKTDEVVLTNGRETYLQFTFTEDLEAKDIPISENNANVVSTEAKVALAEQAI